MAEVFTSIITHLSPRDCQSLRSTCRLLRHHVAVVEGVSRVFEASQNQAGLQQLSGLQRLRLQSPASIFDLHQLSSLTGLTQVVIADASIVDLRPLSCVASLRELELNSVRHYGNLDSLQQLDSVWLEHTAAVPALLQLTALTRLYLWGSSLAARLGELCRLADLCVMRWGAGADNTVAALSNGCVVIGPARPTPGLRQACAAQPGTADGSAPVLL